MSEWFYFFILLKVARSKDVLFLLQLSLTDWHQQIQAGYLDCPFDGCTETFVTVFLLTDHLKEKCKWGRFDGIVICTHCDEKVPCAEMRNHWADSHKDVSSVDLKVVHSLWIVAREWAVW